MHVPRGSLAIGNRCFKNRSDFFRIAVANRQNVDPCGLNRGFPCFFELLTRKRLHSFAGTVTRNAIRFLCAHDLGAALFGIHPFVAEFRVDHLQRLPFFKLKSVLRKLSVRIKKRIKPHAAQKLCELCGNVFAVQGIPVGNPRSRNRQHLHVPDLLNVGMQCRAVQIRKMLPELCIIRILPGGSAQKERKQRIGCSRFPAQRQKEMHRNPHCFKFAIRNTAECHTIPNGAVCTVRHKKRFTSLVTFYSIDHKRKSVLSAPKNLGAGAPSAMRSMGLMVIMPR